MDKIKNSQVLREAEKQGSHAGAWIMGCLALFTHAVGGDMAFYMTVSLFAVLNLIGFIIEAIKD